MSYVTNIIISGLFAEEEVEAVADHLNKMTVDTAPYMRVNSRDVGGQKSLESDLFIAAFNYLDDDEFFENIKGLKGVVEDHTWEDIQVMILLENDEHWKIVLASDLSLYDLS